MFRKKGCETTQIVGLQETFTNRIAIRYVRVQDKYEDDRGPFFGYQPKVIQYDDNIREFVGDHQVGVSDILRPPTQVILRKNFKNCARACQKILKISNRLPH